MSEKRLLPEGLLEIMQCPKCAGTLVEVVDESVLRCQNCGRTYPVDDLGIPDMILHEDETADVAEGAGDEPDD